jgi:hypothetical protein
MLSRISRIFVIVILLCVDGGVSQVVAQSSDSLVVADGLVEKSIHLAEKTLSYLTYENGRHSVAVFPAAGYSPRTGFEYGVMPVWRIQPRDGDRTDYYRPTTITSALLFSTTGMFEVDADIDWRPDGNWVFLLKNQYLFLPDKFYGVGNQSVSVVPVEFDAYRYQLSGQIMKCLQKRWFAGVELNGGYTRHDLTQGESIPATVTGSDGGWANAVGPVLAFDNRNSTSYPSKGAFVKLSYVVASPAFGSQYQYQIATFEGRYFVAPFDTRNIIATQFFVSTSSGDVPFYQLPQLGGKRALRGIPHPYKYIDQYVWYTQAEYRRMIWWRLGGVVYGGMGSSFHEMSHAVSDTRFTGGAGLRVQALPGENLNFRIDYGFASGGDQALYFTIREAF